MKAKTKGVLSIVFGIIGIIILPIVFGPLAIYFGYKAKKEGYKKLGNAGMIIGIVVVILMFFFLIANFVIFPLLGSLWNTSHPVVAMVSGSMSHEGSFDRWWKSQEEAYLKYNITKEQFQTFQQSNGFNVGDILLVKGVDFDELQLGDVIVFKGHRPDPFVSRVVRKYGENGINYVKTKADTNSESFSWEENVKEEQVIGKVSGVVPKLGWVKVLYVRLISSYS